MTLQSFSTLQRPAVIAPALFLLAVILLLPGITELTGITGKDEYLLGFRTPMHMLEGDHGWLPWLDDAPRLRKPPLIYWLGKLSYQAFGISLLSARIIGVLFAALLVMITALIAYHLSGDRRHMLLAGLVALSTIGLMIDGRRLMLDVPVAAMSGVAILFLLRWSRHGGAVSAAASGVALGLAFLIKGPAALVFYAAALVALLATDGAARTMLIRRPWSVPSALAALLLVAAPWFVYLHNLYPELLQQTLVQEVGARDLATLSLEPLLSLIALALPWSPVVIALVVISTRPAAAPGEWLSHRRFLLLWLLLALLPFFFFKSFSRYLYGCLIPLSIFAATLVYRPRTGADMRHWLRAGAVLSLLLGLALLGLVAWFRGFNPLLIAPLLFMAAFTLCWWRAGNLVTMALTAALYWTGLVGLVYPRLGINAIPTELPALVADEYVVLFAGPLPAMLPIATGRGLRDTSRLATLPAQQRDSCRGFLLFSPVKHFVTARAQLKELDHEWSELGRWRLLSSRGSWARIAHEDATTDDWRQAFRNRDLDSIGTEVILVRSRARECQQP